MTVPTKIEEPKAVARSNYMAGTLALCSHCFNEAMDAAYKNDRYSLAFFKDYIEMILKDGGLLEMNKQLAIDQGKAEAAAMYFEAASSLGGALTTLGCAGIGLKKSSGLRDQLTQCNTKIETLNTNQARITDMKGNTALTGGSATTAAPAAAETSAAGGMAKPVAEEPVTDPAVLEEFRTKSYKDTLLPAADTEESRIGDYAKINRMSQTERQKIISRIETEKDEVERQRNTLSNQMQTNSIMFNQTMSQGISSALKGGMDVGKGLKTTEKAEKEAMKTAESTMINMITGNTIEGFNKNANADKQAMDAIAQAYIALAEASHRG